jgi:membrane fusion protein (multidrug efflux system)
MKNKFLVISLTIFLAGCKSNHPVDLTDKSGAGASKIETVKIEKGSLKSVIKVPGQLKPFLVVDIYPKVNGFVKEMYVDRGSVVHEGQLLMTLEAPEIDEQYQAAYSKYLQSQEGFNASRDRYNRLNAAAKTPGAVSELDLVNAQSKYQADSSFMLSEKANVSAVQALKDYLVVRAPFDGVITERNVHPGTLTGPNFKEGGKPLLNLQDNKKLRLELFIPEEYSDKVDMSDKQISFTTDALPGQTFTADISRSANSLNDQYRSEAIEADVINKDNTFKPGMYVEAMLKVKSQVLSFNVPSSAIVTSTERKYVIAVENGKAKYVPVTEGVNSNGITEVYGAFKGDEMILKKANDEITDGANVNQ